MNNQHEMGASITLPSGRVTTLTDRADSANLWMAVPFSGGWAVRRHSSDNMSWVYKLGAPNLPAVWEEVDAFALIRALNSTRPVAPALMP